MENTEEKLKIDETKLDAYDTKIIEQIYNLVSNIQSTKTLNKKDFYYCLFDQYTDNRNSTIANISRDIKELKISDSRLQTIWAKCQNNWLEKRCHINTDKIKHLKCILTEQIVTVQQPLCKDKHRIA